jgi:lipoyl(octanoyl) transferase
VDTDATPTIGRLDAGTLTYEQGLALQARLEAARQRDEIADVLILCEHSPVYTRGRRSTADELPMGEQWYRSQGIEIADTDRGGRVTYHGPGQLVAYPIVSLRPYGDDVDDFIRRMERVILSTLDHFGIEAQTIEGLTGVWTPERRKIASIGVHVSRGVTTHGFAINVNNDLQPFEWIVPCGIDDCQVSSVARETGASADMAELMDVVTERFGAIYDRSPAIVQELALA